MRLVTLLSFTLCLTSCGLFKKTSSSFKEKQGYLITQELQVKQSKSSLKTDNSIDKSELESQSQERIIIYPSKGSKITVGQDGQITGEIDSLQKFINKTSKKVNNILNDITDNTTELTDNNNKTKQQENQETVIKNKTKTPDKASITIIYVIIGIVLVVIVIIIIRKLL